MRLASCALVAITLALVVRADPPPPLCSTISPVSSDFEIRYNGHTSGCSQLLGSSPCLKGETITFNTFSKYDANGCVLKHTWSFGDATAPLIARPADHTFATTGTFHVSVDIITTVNQVTVSRDVTVVESVPALNAFSIVALLLSLSAIALFRIERHY